MRLEIRSLRREFGPLVAVDDVSFGLATGEIWGFVGPNGAGKTTTMRILATLDEPTAGDAFLDGISVVQQPEEARRAIGYMPDSLPLHRDVTVREYLDFFARAYGLAGAARRSSVEDVEAFTRLDRLRDRPIDSLSKGMKQRVSLGRALVHDPSVLVLDEPAAGLDPRARVELRELLRLLAERGKAILISSHILSELAEICHGAVILERGRIVRSGRIGDLSQAVVHTVRLRGLGDRQALHRELLERPEVEAVRPVGDELEADLAGGEEAASELLAALVAGGHRIVEFHHRRSGLEEAFLTLTAGEVQ